MIKTNRCVVIHQDLKSELDQLKTHPRDTYAMVIKNLVDYFLKNTGRVLATIEEPEKETKIQPDVELPNARTE